MATKKWTLERKWDISGTEVRFEELLKNDGFTIEGIKEYVGHTQYLISKDGVSQEYRLANCDNSAKRGNLCYKIFRDCYDMKVELMKLKKEINEI